MLGAAFPPRRHLVAPEGWCQETGGRGQQPERGPGDEAAAVLGMGGNKSISKWCRAACFSVQQARGQQVQQPPCAGCGPRWRAAPVWRAATPVWGFLGVSTSPSSFPSVLEGVFTVETTSAAKDCFSQYNTSVVEQVKYHGDKYTLFLFGVSLHLTPSKCTWLKI